MRTTDSRKQTAGGRRQEADGRNQTAGSRRQENPASAAPASRRLPPAVCVQAFVASRLWCAIFVYLGHASHRFLEPVAGGWAGVANWWLNPWTYFDSLHYIRIAQHGYTPQTATFFPFYPLLLSLAGSNEIALALWGIVLSNACFLVALWLLYRLTLLDYDETTARRAVWLLAFFPTSVFFSAVYTESWFLCWLLAAFLCARHQKWVWAGACGLVAALTRNSGFLVCAALLLDWNRARVNAASGAPPTATNSNSTRWAPMFLLLPLLGFAGVQAVFAARFNGLNGIASQKGYFRQLDWPWLPIWRDLSGILTGRALDLVTLLNVGLTLLAFVLVWRHAKQQRASYALLIIGVLAMHLTLGRIIPPYTIGAARYLMTTFPFVQLLALESRVLNQSRLRLMCGAFIGILICAVMGYLFGEKSFLG